ncbi:hypothetical protein SAMN06297144_0725 [Sphingomonas guangdongensis]|uniref:Uncharacterized protein n=1 Tax=Sphingomonas guangdongensis TaxID=1141890 RepID=A0A285QD68_9SPHN|nr:hypothetical protein [Sphingomonas guangdongensis]SOB79776.1 hypothetical protein SAMN06297144_0725 [Sphingomonas guangdongensis]
MTMPVLPVAEAVCRPTARYRLLAGQLVAAVVGVAALLLSPPVTGAMLLIPVAGGNEGDMIRFAFLHDAQLIGRGPVAGSVMVRGTRARLLPAALAAGLLVIAGGGGCGAGGLR